MLPDIYVPEYLSKVHMAILTFIAMLYLSYYSSIVHRILERTICHDMLYHISTEKQNTSKYIYSTIRITYYGYDSIQNSIGSY